MQGLVIEPCKSASELDTLTTDPLGTINTSFEIPRPDKAFIPIVPLLEKAYCFLATAALFTIFFYCRGGVQHIGIYFKCPLNIPY